MFVRAWVLLGYVRARVLATSFKRLAGHLEHHREPRVGTALNGEQLRQADRIGRVVSMAARHTPWRSPCLSQVLVVQRLMAQRGIPGQFHLGVRRGCDESGDADALAAHAWLQCGEMIVSGEPGHERFTVVSTFSWDAVVD